jgi:hypothetical protein
MAVAAGAMLAALIAFGWLGTYNRLPSADLLWNLAPPENALTMTWDAYNTWSGCFSLFFFMSWLVPISPYSVTVLPGAALGLWLLALLALFHGLLRRWLAGRVWSASLLASAVTLWATVEGTLSGQVLYWANATFKYMAPMLLLTFAAAWIVALSADQSPVGKRPGVVGYTLIALLMFICGGFSETTLAVQVTGVLLALGLSWTHAEYRSLGRTLVVCFGATMVSALVVVLAPGNFARAGWMGPPAPAPAAVARSFWNAGLWTVRFFFWRPAAAISVFAAGWLVASLNPSPGVDVAMFQRQVQRRLTKGLFAALALLVASFFPVAYILGIFPQSRILIVPQFLLVLTVFACGCSCAAVLNVTQPGTLAVRSFHVFLCTVLIGAPLWSVYQTFQSRTDAARYAMLWDRRDQRLRAAARAGQLDVVLDPLPEDLALARGIRVPFENPDIARFYGFRSVTQVGSHNPVAEAWTQEAWTTLTGPEYLPHAIRGFLRRIRRTIRGS